MKGHRLQLAALLLAVASFGAYGILPASASGPAPNAPARISVFSVDTNAIVATWAPATVPTGGSAVTGYVLTPTPACGGCTGLTTSGATSSRVVGLTNGTTYTFTVHASNGTAGPESAPSAGVKPAANGSTCQFDSFPAIPGSSSELAVACTLSTDIGGAGNHYNIEDFPQAQWNNGAGRVVKTTAATAATVAVITASAGHFTAQDVNDTIAGPGIPANAFVKSVTATTATLDKVVGAPGVASGATLTLNNSDGRTFTDGVSPATTVTGGTSTVAVQTTHIVGAQASTETTMTVTAAGTTNFPTHGSLSVPTSGSGAVTPAKFTYTGVSGGNKFTGLHKVSGAGTMATGVAVTLTGITSVSGLQTATLRVVSATSFAGSGDVTVTTNTPAGTAVLSYTGTTTTSLTGVAFVSGSAGVTNTVGAIATAAKVNQATDITGLGTLNVTSTTGFSSPSGTATVATNVTGGAVVDYTGTTGTSLTGVTLDSGSGFVSTGAAVGAVTSDIINSVTAHFCAPGITPTTCDVGGNQKDDSGRGISGTRIPPGTTITSVISNTQIQLSANTIACPAGVTSCGQLGISALDDLSTARQIQDATFPLTTKLCSMTANFNQTDVNLPIASVGTPVKIPVNDYIASVATGCPVGATGVNLHVASVAGVNANVVIGSPDSSAPKNGDAVMSLSSALSVSPTLAPGEPDCSFGTPVGSNLEGKWLNPGSFDLKSLGALPNTGVTGPVIAQLDVTTGTGNPAFAGYAVQATSTNSPGDNNTAPHIDLVFPALLTGVAVCPAPSTVGVATVFRFFGETLSQSAAGTGDVRALLTPTNAGTNDVAWEHILANPTTDVFDASGTCHFENSTTGPGSANYTICHGQ